MTLSFLLFCFFFTTAWCQTRSVWEYLLGPQPANPYTSSPSQDHAAQQAAFSLADPIPDDGPAWKVCYPGDQWCTSASQLGVHYLHSRLPDNDCWQTFAFAYYQTFVTVPAGVTVSQFTIEYPGNVVDDAARISIYNSLYPTGATLAFSFYQEASSVNLAPHLTTGINRVIITQEDSCCCGNSILAIVKLNGAQLDPTCEPPADLPCQSSTWDPVSQDCVLTPATGPSCSDGNSCTVDDTCVAGVCTPGAPKVCTALDQCHLPGVCDPATGECSNPPKCDGKKCDDGNACTQLDTCKSGVCVGKRPVVCTVENDCQEPGTCEPSTGICSPPDNKCDGTGCDDGNKCTLTDSCVDGECFGTNPRVCEPIDACHDAGECDPVTGACSNPNKADGSPCDDGNACTQTDTCKAGVCVGSNPKKCTALDQCHVAGVCEPSTGECSTPNKNEGASCNDGNACTKTDTCKSGVCTGNNPVVCKASDQCHEAGVCAPETGKCSDPKKANGAACNDGDKCTEHDTCSEGKCVGSGQLCCRTSRGRCGTCVSDCRGSHQSVLTLFKQWNRNGRQCGPDDVDTGSSGCSGGKVCCVPRDQSTCRNDNNSCRIPEDD